MSVEMKITEESVKSKNPPSMPPVPDEAKKTIETESDKEKESSNKHTVDVKTLKVILEMLSVLSARGSFRIDEFSVIGNYYEKVVELLRQNMEESQVELDSDVILSFLNILGITANRGSFKLEEYNNVFKVYEQLKKVIES
jgi:hypothetical protein